MCVLRNDHPLKVVHTDRSGQATGRSRNATDASERGHPASGRPRPQAFVMVLAQVHATTLQMISPGYPSAVVSDFPPLRGIYNNHIASWHPVGLWYYRFQSLTRRIVDYKYVDETADIARHYSVDWGCGASSPLASERRRSERSEASLDQRALTEPSIISDTVGSHSSEQFLPHRPVGGALAGYSPYPLELSPGNHSSLSSASPGYSHSSQVSPGSRDLISQVENGLPNLDEHEACLMRYFVVQLAPWVCFPSCQI